MTATPAGPAYIDRHGRRWLWNEMPEWHRRLILRTWRICGDLSLARAKMLVP